MGGSTPTYLSYATTQDAAVVGAMESIIGNALAAVWPVVHWLAVIYIVIAFAQVTANLMTVNAFLGKAVRLFFVAFLIHSSGIYTQYVEKLAFVDMPNEIATVASGATVGISAAGQFDKVSQAADFLVADAKAKNAGHSIFSVSAIGNEIGIYLADVFINLVVAFMFGVWLRQNAAGDRPLLRTISPWVRAFRPDTRVCRSLDRQDRWPLGVSACLRRAAANSDPGHIETAPGLPCSAGSRR